MDQFLDSGGRGGGEDRQQTLKLKRVKPDSLKSRGDIQNIIHPVQIKEVNIICLPLPDSRGVY